jgi:hypothetical protein
VPSAPLRQTAATGRLTAPAAHAHDDVDVAQFDVIAQLRRAEDLQLTVGQIGHFTGVDVVDVMMRRTFESYTVAAPSIGSSLSSPRRTNNCITL